MKSSVTLAHQKAMAMLDSLPVRSIGPSSTKLYSSLFRRLWSLPVIDPLRLGDSRDYYNVKKAAVVWGGQQLLERLLKKFQKAADEGNVDCARRLGRILQRVVSRLEPAFALEPPQRDKIPNFYQPSRWSSQEMSPQRGVGSKRHVLKRLPLQWREIVWAAVPQDSIYRDPIAGLMLSAARPGEYIPGPRARGHSPGILVTRDKDHLTLETCPLKSHDGKYGADRCGIRILIPEGGPAAVYLGERCLLAGGVLVICLETGDLRGTSDKLRKYVGRIGRIVFPAGPQITPYVYRSARLADIKAWAKDGGASAATAAGHSNDGTQRKYGHAAYGNPRGIVGVYSSREVRLISATKVMRLRQKTTNLGLD